MKNKIIKISTAAILFAMVSTSCKKSFLDEKLETVRELTFYQTDAGIHDLQGFRIDDAFVAPAA